MLVLGSSKPWKEVMEVMTGQPDMNTDAFREYFKPLEDWLIQENRKNNVKVGWKNPPLETMCKPSTAFNASTSIQSMSLLFLLPFIFSLFR